MSNSIAVEIQKVAGWRKAAVFLLLVGFISAIVFDQMSLFVFLLLFASVLILCALRPSFALYGLAAVSFFSGWFVSISRYEWAKRIPIISGIDAPIADLFAVFALLAVCIGWFHFKSEIRKFSLRRVPNELRWYGLFLISSLISVFFAYERSYSLSAWYWLRMIVFTYPGYVFVPYVVAHKESIIKNVLKIWFVIGVIVAIYGLSSLYVNSDYGWTRVKPYMIFGFTPLGVNHNQLAEVLSVIIPLGVYFIARAWQEKKRGLLNFYLVGTILMITSCLLTLSRAAWVTLAGESVFALIFYWREIKMWLKGREEYLLAGASVMVIILGYMMYFMISSNVVSSSTVSRLDATNIALFYVNRSPVFGYGPGMYTNILGGTLAYTMEYGDPLEAHGFIQKILLEEGFIGLGLFVLFLLAIFSHLLNAQKERGEYNTLARALFIMAFGAVLFQLFNTEYFSSVMWLPIGIALAHARIKNETI